MKQETYHSSTLGNIPLSFTGRRLLQNLREAFGAYAEKVRRAANLQLGTPRSAWEPVSTARGEIAQYISGLERRVSALESLHKVSHGDDSEALIEAFMQAEEEPLPPLVFGKLQESAPPVINNIQLPPIPEGYALYKLGDMISIQPFDYSEGKDA